MPCKSTYLATLEAASADVSLEVKYAVRKVDQHWQLMIRRRSVCDSGAKSPKPEDVNVATEK